VSNYRRIRRGALIGALAAVSSLALTATALAHEGEFAKFNDCPSTTTGVLKCVNAVTYGGTIVLGNKTTPIVNPVTLQGGISKPDESEQSTFFAASDGNTLSKTPEPVPGGLADLIPKSSVPALLLPLYEAVFENGLTGVNATLELAKPASEIRISEFNLLLEEETALHLPVKVHLENPFLGSSCYVGSSSSPIIWNLTSGETSPPAPNTPIHGSSGLAELKEEGRIVTVEGAKLVDNSWAAPTATGCGGALSLLLDPVVNTTVGLPAAAGKNTAILENNINVATAVAVNNH
jgi:hypothetical protein